MLHSLHKLTVSWQHAVYILHNTETLLKALIKLVHPDLWAPRLYGGCGSSNQPCLLIPTFQSCTAQCFLIRTVPGVVQEMILSVSDCILIAGKDWEGLFLLALEDQTHSHANRWKLTSISCLAVPKSPSSVFGLVPLSDSEMFLCLAAAWAQFENFHSKVWCHSAPETFSKEVRHSSQLVCKT